MRGRAGDQAAACPAAVSVRLPGGDWRRAAAELRLVAKTVAAAPDGRMTKAIAQSGGSRRS